MFSDTLYLSHYAIVVCFDLIVMIVQVTALPWNQGFHAIVAHIAKGDDTICVLMWNLARLHPLMASSEITKLILQIFVSSKSHHILFHTIGFTWQTPLIATTYSFDYLLLGLLRKYE